VKKVVAAHDVGRAVNPKACEGQIEGGVAMAWLRADREFCHGGRLRQDTYATLGLFAPPRCRR
jgi:CO/xanthine dehydrogenase Mo-binding subunit